MVFDELFVSCMPNLYYAASRVLRNPQDAEDAVQDGLLSAFRNLDQFQGRSKFSTWLHSIVVNAARMKLRKQRQQPTASTYDEAFIENGLPLADMLVDSKPSPEKECARAQRSRILMEMMRVLPSSYQTAIRLCYFEGLTDREAAELLGISVGALKARLHQARNLLHRRMKWVIVPLEL